MWELPRWSATRLRACAFSCLIRKRMGETARLDVRYEGCFSGPAGINGWLGATLGFIFGILLGVLAASSVTPAAAPVAGIGVWIGCTVLFAVFCRTRRFSVRLHADRADIVARRGVHSIPYAGIRFVDAGVRLDTFKGGEWPNARVRIRVADGHTTRIGIDRTAASSLVEELRYRCPKAGGINLDETHWLPDDPASRNEARRRLRGSLVVRTVAGLVLGGGWLAIVAVLAVLVASSHRQNGTRDRLRDWSELAIASMAVPFALRTFRRGAQAWARRKAV